MRIILRILSYLKNHKLRVFFAYFSLAGSTISFMAMPRLLGESVDSVLDQGSTSFLIWAGLAILGAAVFRGIFSFFDTYMRETLGQRVAYDIRNVMFNHLQGMSFAYHDKQQTGQLMARATADVENIRMFIGMGVLRMSYLFFMTASVLALLLTLDWKLALMSLAFIPFIVGRSFVIGGQLRKIWTRAQERTGELGIALQESLSGIRVVKAFSRQEHENANFSSKAGELAKENLASVRVMATNTPMMAFLFTASTALVLWFGGQQIIDGSFTAGELTQFLLYLAMLQMPIRMLGFMINLISRGTVSGQRIFEILDAVSPVRERPDAIPLDGIQGHVVMDHVSFGYDGASPVLRDVSIEAKPGEVVALLGATGSGKTTIVNLLPRFYDVTEGSVLLDGIDVRTATLESLRNKVGIVQQDVFLFSASIRDNIAYGAHNASDEDVIEAAKAAQLHNFILDLPEGYDTWVGERGVTLSGGQKQRLAIARTLLLDPAVLILDDSTSSVDTRTEHLIRQALESLIQGRTTFVIAQRLSTAKNADQILVLKDGEIIQRGKHEELLAEGGLYSEIYELQLRPQEEAGEAVTARDEASS